MTAATALSNTKALSARMPAWPWAAIVLLAPAVLWGVFGPWISPYDPTIIDLARAQQAPAWLPGGDWTHVLGTDQFGRDLLSRLIDGARVSLIVSIVGVLGAALIGISAGMVAGYYGKAVDAILMQIVDIKMSIPATLLIILLGSAIGGGMGTIVISVVLLFWADYARVVRGETLTLRERDYIALARVANCSDWRILTRHILPNILPTCIVLLTLQVGRAILIEAGISFLGLGVQPPATSWGLMVFEGRSYTATAWWLPTFSGLAITLTVLGVNLFGDWLRDRLDIQSKTF